MASPAVALPETEMLSTRALDGSISQGQSRSGRGAHVPLAQPRRTAFAVRPTPRTAIRLLPADVSVLAISADSALKALLETVLLPAGVATLNFLQPSEVLFEALSDQKAGVVIIDDAPPAIDAIELTLRLRQDPDSPDNRVRIFSVLARDSIERTLDALNAGTHEVLFKPFQPGKLVSTMRASLKDRREFIEVNGYVGPNRRRVSAMDYRGPLRRAGDTPF